MSGFTSEGRANKETAGRKTATSGMDVEMTRGEGGWEQGKKAKSSAEGGRKKTGVSISQPRALAAGKFNFDPVDSAVIPKFNL